MSQVGKPRERSDIKPLVEPVPTKEPVAVPEPVKEPAKNG